MNPHFIPVNEPILDGNERRYLNECIDTGWISSEGPFIKRFEKAFSEKVSRKQGVAVCNGSAALELSVAALGIGCGDEVIMPSFTIISCAAAIVRAGAVPVLVDQDPVSWNMNVDELEAKITSRTKAIMAVHIYGLPVDLKPLMEIAHRHGLRVIEDAAEMHGQTYMGKPCGSFGDVSIFSFYPNKHLTTGEGGMVVTDDEVLADRCRSFRNLCFSTKKRFVHDELGWNFRMTNLQAALGVAQLEQLDRFVALKRNIGERYNRLLSDVSGVQLPLSRTHYSENIYWVYGVVLQEEIAFDAESAMKMLADAGVGTRPFFWPMHEQPVFINRGLFKEERYPVAEKLARRGFYLPSGLALTEEDQVRVADSLRRILK